MKKAVFLDRDGTLNVEKEYLYRPADFEFIPRAIDALKIINKLGYIIVIVSNQSGIARGYYLKEDVDKLHQFIDFLLAPYGVAITKYYYCPHHPSITGLCECRKPAIGMFKLAEHGKKKLAKKHCNEMNKKTAITPNLLTLLRIMKLEYSDSLRK